MLSCPRVRSSSLFFLKLFFFLLEFSFCLGWRRSGIQVPVKWTNMFSLRFLHFKPSLQGCWRGKQSTRAVPCPSFAAVQVEVCRIIRMGIYIFWGKTGFMGPRIASWRLLNAQLLIIDVELTALGRVLQTLRKDFEYSCRFFCLLLFFLAMDSASGSIYFWSKHFCCLFFCGFFQCWAAMCFQLQ